MGPVNSGDEKVEEEEMQRDDKKLYQIKEGAWITGVCMGLAAYFNVDVIIIRIIFVVLTLLTHGAFIFVYIIMMYIVPWAKTPEQKAKAHGETFSADEFFKKTSAKYQQLREKHILPEGISEEQFSENWKILHHFANRIFAIIIGLFTGIIIWVWILSLISIFSSGTVFGYTLGSGVAFWILPLFVTSLFFILFWPLKSWIRNTLVAAGVYRRDLKKSEKAVNIVGWIVWVIALIVFVVLCFIYASAIGHIISHFQQVITHGKKPENWKPFHY